MKTCSCRSGLLHFVLGVLFVFRLSAQTDLSTLQQSRPHPQIKAAPIPADQQVFLTAQKSLTQEGAALIEQGATSEKLAEWRKQNASLVDALAQQARATSAALEPISRPQMKAMVVPEGASETLVEFLQTKASLMNARTQFQKKAGSSVSAISEANKTSLQQGQAQSLKEQNAGTVRRLQQLGQALAKESVRQTEKFPPRPVIPADASPQMKDFLTQRYALMKERTQIRNQSIDDDSSKKRAAMQQWSQLHAEQIEKFRRAIEALSAASTSVQPQ